MEIILIGGLLAAGVLVIGLLLYNELSTAFSSRKDPPGLSPAQLLPPTVQWQRPIAGSRATSYGTLFMVLGLVGMLIVLFVAVILILAGVAGGQAICPLGLFLLVILAGSGGFFAKGLRDWRKEQTLTSQGQLVQGVLFDRWVKYGKSRRDYVAYYFEPPGQAGVIRTEINSNAYRKLRIGDSVQVRYMPEEPQICRLEA